MDYILAILKFIFSGGDREILKTIKYVSFQMVLKAMKENMTCKCA